MLLLLRLSLGFYIASLAYVLPEVVDLKFFLAVDAEFMGEITLDLCSPFLWNVLSEPGLRMIVGLNDGIF